MRARQIKLSEAEDAQLRQVEQQAGLHEKVRLRAKVLRLSHRGMQAREIAAYTGRHLSSVACCVTIAAGSSRGSWV